MIQTQSENITYSLSTTLVISDITEPCHDDMLCLSLENTILAMCSLSPLALFFYMFFVISKTQASNPFSGSEFCEATDLPYEIYMDAVSELIDNHYLTLAETDPPIFYFNDRTDIPLDIQHHDQADQSDLDEVCDDDVW